jgi:hypothetical protein
MSNLTNITIILGTRKMVHPLIKLARDSISCSLPFTFTRSVGPDKRFAFHSLYRSEPTPVSLLGASKSVKKARHLLCIEKKGVA